MRKIIVLLFKDIKRIEIASLSSLGNENLNSFPKLKLHKEIKLWNGRGAKWKNDRKVIFSKVNNVLLNMGTDNKIYLSSEVF